MASAETRDVVKQYELRHNSFLKALRPGGALASVEVKGPSEALLVPRQVSLDAIHIIPFLEAKLQLTDITTRRSPTLPLSELLGEEHATPNLEKSEYTVSNGTNEGTFTQASVTSQSPSGVYYSSENEAEFRETMRTFLEYHLLHFNSFGNSDFTTLRGQRGAFSEDLDHVKRFGHIGQVAVLADADPLLPQTTSSGGGKPRQGSSALVGENCVEEKTYHPAELQIFIIDRPLMDATEIGYLIDTLRRLTTRDARNGDATTRLNALFSNPTPAAAKLSTPQPLQSAPQQPTGKSAELPFLMDGISNFNCAGADTSTVAAATASPPEGRQSTDFLLGAADSDDGSIGETIIIDNFEEDVPDEPDLAPYVSKYTQISEQQRRRSKTSHASDETAAGLAGASFSVVAGRAVVSNNTSSNSATLVSSPLPGPSDLNCGGVSGVAQVGTHVMTAKLKSSTSTPICVAASLAESTEVHPTNSLGHVVSVTLTAHSMKANKPAATAAATTHTNVLRHEYSRECIKDYRRVVSADNEIHYDVFEQLMKLRCNASLAKLMSSYVSKNQQLQQPILNNMKYNKFIGSCHALIQQVPRFAQHQKQLTIMHEGIERYVTSRLYRQLYNVSEDEKQQNAMLQSKFLRLENLTAKELDALPEVERHHVWGQAMFELDGMDFFKSPREKLRCGMRSCELLSLAVGDILRQRRNAKIPNVSRNSTSELSGGSVPFAFGADEFLPCFLLLVLRARPLNYVQNICYIEKFRCSSLLSPEESYCFATLQSAMMFWLNCKDNGRMDASPAPAKATSSPQSGGGSNETRANTGQVSVAALTNAAAVVAPLPPPAAVPQMTERDLLPSVRQASYTARTHDAAAAAATALPGFNIVAQEDSPSVLDVLFGWANRSFVPLVDEIGAIGSGSRKTTESADVFASNEAAAAPLPTPSKSAMTAAAPAVKSTFTGQLVKASANLSHFHAGQVVPTSQFPNEVPSVPPPSVHTPDANTRALVRELLVTQHKTFEQLTLTEIQMVVEEARALLMEK